MNDGELLKAEAEEIEGLAADLAYVAGLGVSEWEAFLSEEQVNRLLDLGRQGYGTWGREPETLKRMEAVIDELKQD